MTTSPAVSSLAVVSVGWLGTPGVCTLVWMLSGPSACCWRPGPGKRTPFLSDGVVRVCGGFCRHGGYLSQVRSDKVAAVDPVLFRVRPVCGCGPTDHHFAGRLLGERQVRRCIGYAFSLYLCLYGFQAAVGAVADRVVATTQ